MFSMTGCLFNIQMNGRKFLSKKLCFSDLVISRESERMTVYSNYNVSDNSMTCCSLNN